MTDREGSLDILVNNAGATWGATLDEYPAKAWDRVLDLNLKGLFFLTQSLLPALRVRTNTLPAPSTSAHSKQSRFRTTKPMHIPPARPQSTNSLGRSRNGSVAIMSQSTRYFPGRSGLG